MAIAANRNMVMSLARTNIFGQNTPAIATGEAEYGEMWGQDIVAMESYAGTSAAASKLTPFTPPPQTTNPAGLVSKAATAAAQAAAPAAALPSLPALAASLQNPLAELDLLVLAAVSLSAASLGVWLGQLSEAIRHDETDEYQKDEELQQNPGKPLSWEQPALVSRPGRAAEVSDFTGRAATLGGLSVPQTWALPPQVRQLAAMLPGTAAPIFMQDGSDDSYAGMAAAGLIGSAMTGLVARGGGSSPSPAAATAAGGKSGGAAGTAAARPAPAPAAVIPTNPPTNPAASLPPGVAENTAAALAAIPGATIIVVPPSPNQ